MPFFSLVTFITTLQCNIKNLLVNRVSEPLVRSKVAITLELIKLCQSNLSSGIERQKEGHQGKNITLFFTGSVNLFLIPYFLADFCQFSKRG